MKKIKNILKAAKAFWDKGGEQSKAKKAEKNTIKANYLRNINGTN